MEWLVLCTEANKLQVSLYWHIYRRKLCCQNWPRRWWTGCIQPLHWGPSDTLYEWKCESCDWIGNEEYIDSSSGICQRWRYSWYWTDTIFQRLEIHGWTFTGGRIEQTWDGCEGENHGAAAWRCPSITGYLQSFRWSIHSWDTLLDTWTPQQSWYSWKKSHVLAQQRAIRYGR